jgi:hypothetical protein
VDQPRTLERPKVLLLYTDQQRRDSVGCYGSPFAATPHLDALAADGRRFEGHAAQRDHQRALHRASARRSSGRERGHTLQTARYLYGCDTGGRELLYDKQEDPAELCDVVSDGRYAPVRDELRHQLNVRLQQARFSARPRVARY